MNNEREKLFSLGKKCFDVTTYMGSGPGGQKRNKTSSCVRIKHIETGITKQCCEHRSQHKNKEEAFRKFVTDKDFLRWIKLKASRALNDIENYLDETMISENIKVEYMNEDGNWEVSDENNKM